MLAHLVVREAKLAFRQRGKNLGGAISEPEIRVTVIDEHWGETVSFALEVFAIHSIVALFKRWMHSRCCFISLLAILCLDFV